MAHKKGVGSTDNGRDSHSKRLGVKLFGGEEARAGNIIIRQRGTKFHPGRNVGLGKDHTIYALKDGYVRFHKKRRNRTYVSIIPTEDVLAAVEQERSQNGNGQAKTEPKEPKKAAAEAKQSRSEEPSKPKTDTSTSDQASTPDKEAKAEETKKEKSAKPDDLKKLDGVGPKTAEVLQAAGIQTYEQLASKTPEELKEILLEESSRFGHFDTSSWPRQAEFLAEGDNEGLKAYLKKLKEE